MSTWHGDGIIANFDHPRVVSQISASGIAVVAFGSGFGWYDPDSSIPYFYSDNRAVVKLAAEHLYHRGFRRFAYYGYRWGPTCGFSTQRADAFERFVGAVGCPLSVHEGPYEDHRKWEPLQQQLRSWLEGLPKPVGLMAVNDKAARQVLEACRVSGLRVPDEIAVVGVDNDEMLCQLSNPPLSSVEQARAEDWLPGGGSARADDVGPTNAAEEIRGRTGRDRGAPVEQRRGR